MNLEVGPGSVWATRDSRGRIRMVVLLVDEVEGLAGKPGYRSVVLMDSEWLGYEGRVISCSRSHLLKVFERLI